MVSVYVFGFQPCKSSCHHMDVLITSFNVLTSMNGLLDLPIEKRVKKYWGWVWHIPSHKGTTVQVQIIVLLETERVGEQDENVVR